MTTHTKILHPGHTSEGYPVFVRAEIRFKGERRILSLVGVEGPLHNGDCRGSCGQIDLRRVTRCAEGWGPETVEELRQVWERWHLNDMLAGCEHQRAEGWDERPIDPAKPLNSYGRHFEGQQQPSWNMLVGVGEKEHPNGLLGRACPMCGYRYGSEWRYEELPGEVVAFVKGLPKSERVPAWV